MFVFRPTLKAIKMLPRESFGDPALYDAVISLRSLSIEERREAVNSLDLRGLDHSLLKDGRKYFEQGRRPDTHLSSSQALGQPVYEVRSGDSGWLRGAVIQAATPSVQEFWLVYADQHNRFHRHAEQLFGNSNAQFWPTKVDKKLLALDQLRTKREIMHNQVYETLLDGIRRAISCLGLSIVIQLSLDDTNCFVSITVQLFEDEVGGDLDTMYEVDFVVNSAYKDFELRDFVINAMMALLEPSPDCVEQVYAPGQRGLHYFMFVSQARIRLLLSDPKFVELITHPEVSTGVDYATSHQWAPVLEVEYAVVPDVPAQLHSVFPTQASPTQNSHRKSSLGFD